MDGGGGFDVFKAGRMGHSCDINRTGGKKLNSQIYEKMQHESRAARVTWKAWAAAEAAASAKTKEDTTLFVFMLTQRI